MSRFAPEGTWTALVTPFSEDASRIDWEAVDRHVEFQIEGGVTGLVPCGTTGEAPTLSDQEQAELIGRVVKRARGRVGVLAGVGSNSTARSVAAARVAAEAGADAVMVVVPYYNKPSQAGIQRHFEEVAGAVELPVVLYNVPGRTVANLEPETLYRVLDRCANVVAVKDATNNVTWCQQVLSEVRDRVRILCGDDALTVALMSVGATGVISVTSNVLPAAVSNVTRLAAQGRFDQAAAAHSKLLPIHGAMFCAPSPVPAKVALANQGHMTEAVRLPLVAPSAAERTCVLDALARVVS